ncbi:MAG: DNA-3-methyladenine glycosylase, partial [Candidatus Andersenbacteria bacterium]|nr:DNA-3-methyladenine glycosylase [Candidatus Andersenbacteria bacterium]
DEPLFSLELFDFRGDKGFKTLSRKLHQLTSGPGKLCQALNITRALNGIDMTNSKELFIQDDGFHVEAKDIESSPRIGVAYAGACALYPWRYYVQKNSFVSK